jgi:hypothetical protein
MRWIWPLVLALVGCGPAPVATVRRPVPPVRPPVARRAAPVLVRSRSQVKVVVKQPPGRIVYWVVPGPRRLDERVFGTPQRPLLTGEVPPGTPLDVATVLRHYPFPLGVPLEMRGVSADGQHFTETLAPTPEGDHGIPVSGAFRMTLYDRADTDEPGHKPLETADAVMLDATFTDPDGNQYRLHPTHVVAPPIPGWETQGGVLRNGVLGGASGTGSPLLPKLHAYAAFWAVGDVVVNGRAVNRDVLIHFMTTEVARHADFRVAFDGDLPVPADEAIGHQRHETHALVLPIRLTAQGMSYEPVQTPYRPYDGSVQDFIHVVFEQDEIDEGPAYAGP